MILFTKDFAMARTCSYVVLGSYHNTVHRVHEGPRVKYNGNLDMAYTPGA